MKSTVLKVLLKKLYLVEYISAHFFYVFAWITYKDEFWRLKGFYV